MEKIEIRYHKKNQIMILIISILAFFGVIFRIYLPGKFEDNIWMQIVYVFLDILILSTIYETIKNIRNPEPILTFTESSLNIKSNGETFLFAWDKIIEWKVEQIGDENPKLKVQTSNDKKDIDLAFLEKTLKEIEALMNKYCKAI